MQHHRKKSKQPKKITRECATRKSSISEASISSATECDAELLHKLGAFIDTGASVKAVEKVETEINASKTRKA